MKFKHCIVLILTALMLLTILPMTVYAESLQKGDKSDDVYALQKALAYKNIYKGQCTGTFTAETETAVKSFQKANRLTADGLAGKKTLVALGIASDAKVIQSGTVKVDGQGLNMRNGASSSNKILVMLKNGTKISIIGSSGSWYKIRLSGGVEGYVLKSYITTSGSASTTQKSGKVKVSTKLTVRSGAGSSYSAKGYIKNGAVVSITGESGDWYKIKTSTGLVGYCNKEFITITNASSSSDTAKNVPTQKLERGMENNNVVILQERLKELGYFNNKCTGFYGSITVSAVKAFQKANSLTADGIAGPKTLQELFSDNAVPKKEAANQEQSDPVKAKIEEMIAYAKTFLGKRYVYGANGPNSFDCTGFTCYVFKHFGYTLPRSAYTQGYTDYALKITKKSDLKRGDLVFFNTINDNDKSDHAGIYLGNNEFIHASSGKSMSVVIGNLTTDYYVNRFSWGRRVIT